MDERPTTLAARFGWLCARREYTGAQPEGVGGVQKGGDVPDIRQMGQIAHHQAQGQDVMMAKRKIGLSELAPKVGLTLANLSILNIHRSPAIKNRGTNRAL